MRPQHEAIYWASNNQLAVRKGNWKLVKDGIVFDGTPEGSKPLTADDALFLSNLQEDAGESRNLRHAHPEMVDELETQASKLLADVSGNHLDDDSMSTFNCLGGSYLCHESYCNRYRVLARLRIHPTAQPAT